jgi:cytochrome c5
VTISKKDLRLRLSGTLVIVAAAVAIGPLTTAIGPVTAQEAAAPAQPAAAAAFEPNPQLVKLGAQIWKTKATCRNCHGALGNGVGDIPQEPQGANFRVTILTPEQFEETIQCGRPATAMPHFDPKAYTDDRCFGLTAADLGDEKPPSGGTLSPRERQAITQFVFANYVGKPAPTFEECVAFWGEAASTCTRYPKAAN